MNVCTKKDCQPFDPCFLTPKERKKVICQYPGPKKYVTAKDRRENDKWIKKTRKKTDIRIFL
jgi:hypothetical protein